MPLDPKDIPSKSPPAPPTPGDDASEGSRTPTQRMAKVELTLCKHGFLPGQRITFHRVMACAFRGERIVFKGDVLDFAIKRMVVNKHDAFVHDEDEPQLSTIPAAMFANAPVFEMDGCPRGETILVTIECIARPLRWWQVWRRELWRRSKKLTFFAHMRLIGTVLYDTDSDLKRFMDEDLLIRGVTP